MRPGRNKPNFNDIGWRRVNLPNDWSIEGPFAETNRASGAGAFLPSGVAWYRTTFSLPNDFANRRVFIEFDGVMANSDVWINGVLLGHRPYGYVSFGYELTGHLNFGGAANVLAVRADTSAAAGIALVCGRGDLPARSRLVVTDRSTFADNGVFVIARRKFRKRRRRFILQCTVTNESDSSERSLYRKLVSYPAGEIWTSLTRVDLNSFTKLSPPARSVAN